MDEWSQEQHKVAEAFQKGMSAFKREPLVLYGIGKNTLAVLGLTDGFSIVGLLDQDDNNVGKEFYGKRVLTLEEAASASRRIVIIARTTITPVIYCRIKDFVREHGITVYNYSGRELGTPETYSDLTDLDYWNYDWEDLKAEIGRHTVISFDIFDTILGRYVLFPRDVFSLVERDLRVAGRNVPFERLRVQAERECGYAASLDDIYERLHQFGISEADCQDWKQRELRWERNITFPKTRAVAAFRYAKSLGKKTFLVSDMYLPRVELAGLLSIHGISGYDGLLVSNEESAEKSDGKLFESLLAQTGGQDILHIGDNKYSDVDMAQRVGLDAWLLYSSYDLLGASSFRTLIVNPPPDLGSRLALGMLCAKLFEDPFALHQTRGMVRLTEPEQVGYCFIGPWALSFMQWAAERLEENNIERFLLLSRDGFLFFHIGQIMRKYGYMPGVDLQYIKTSRRALIGASIQSEEDLAGMVFGSSYVCSNGEMLLNWFRVVPDPADTKRHEHAAGEEAVMEYLRPYFPQIQARSNAERKNLHMYLVAEDLFCGRKMAVFDFVAAGTAQYYLEQHLGTQLLGIYCARHITRRLEKHQKEISIISAFDDVCTYGKENVWSRAYVAIEALLVDGDSTLACFDESGEPVFQPESGFSYEQPLKVQEFARQFVSDYLTHFGAESISLRCAEQLLDTLFSSACKVEAPVLKSFVHDDKVEVGDEDIPAIFSG